jgi:hypothetical protein
MRASSCASKPPRHTHFLCSCWLESRKRSCHRTPGRWPACAWAAAPPLRSPLLRPPTQLLTPCSRQRVCHKRTWQLSGCPAQLGPFNSGGPSSLRATRCGAAPTSPEHGNTRYQLLGLCAGMRAVFERVAIPDPGSRRLPQAAARAHCCCAARRAGPRDQPQWPHSRCCRSVRLRSTLFSCALCGCWLGHPHQQPPWPRSWARCPSAPQRKTPRWRCVPLTAAAFPAGCVAGWDAPTG